MAIDENLPNGPPPNEVYTAPADQQTEMELEFSSATTTNIQTSAGGSVHHLHAISTPATAGDSAYTMG